MAAITSVEQIRDNARAFDSVAAEYDGSNRRNVLLEMMRARSLRMLTEHAPPHGHVLDLGCGPGTDFEELLARGHTITALENSPRMASQARARAIALGATDRVEVVRLAIEDLALLAPTKFDAAYSSFGPLNCVTGLGHVATALAGRIRPGGALVASVLGRVCPWEIAYYAARRNRRRIMLRFSHEFVPVPIGRETIWTRYYWPGEFEKPFLEAGFVRVGLRSLGLFTPPPYMDAAARRHLRATSILTAVDDGLGALPMFRSCGDHFLIALARS